MNNLPLKPVGGVGGEAEGVCVGAQGAPSANFTVGAVAFAPQWTTEDSMAASIIRLEQENEELRAEVALAEAERIELAKMLCSERQMHAQCQNERDELRMRLEGTK